MNYYPSDAANFFVAFSAVNIISYISRFGSDNYILKSAKQDDFGGQLSAIYFVSIVVSFVFSFVLVLFFDYIFVFLFFLCNTFFTLLQISARCYARDLKGIKSAFVMNAVSLMILSVFFFLEYFVFDIEYKDIFLWMWCVSLMLAALVCMPYSALKKFNVRNCFNVVISSRVFFVSGVLNLIMYWGGQVASGYALQKEHVEAIALAQRLSAAMGLISIASSIYLSPRISSMHEEGRLDELSGLVRKCNLFVVLSCSACAMIIILFSDFIVKSFNVSLEYSWVIVLTSICQLIFCVFSNSLQVLNMTGNETYTRRSVYFGVFSFFVLCGFSIALNNIYLMVAAVNVPLMVQGFISFLYVKRKLNFSSLALV
ncbi:hypothetical protein [Rheinheimera marina]